MRVLALGGAGNMGRMAVAILLESAKVNKITIADKDLNLVNAYLERVNNDKLSTIEMDIRDKEKLISLLKAHDIVINTVGPFYKYVMPIVEATIEAKKPYLDINDDWKPTLEVLKLDEKAKHANLTAVIGIGASPGITNLLALIACSKLDRIEEIITAWGESIGMKEGKRPKYYVKEKDLRKNNQEQKKRPNAAIQHWLYETLEKIPTVKDGKIIEIEPLTETEKFSFPSFKSMYACHIGHPEPVTLNRIMKAERISNIMYVGETLTEHLRNYREKILKNELTIEDASLELEQVIRKITKLTIMSHAPLKEYLGGPPTLSAIAIGDRKGERTKMAVALKRNPYDEMAGVTGVPLALATLMVIEGNIPKKGILTPEEAINPIDFFNKLAVYCGKNLTADDILIQKEVRL